MDDLLGLFIPNERAFFHLRELRDFGLPAEKTLRNRIRAGLIDLGSEVPPLRTVRLAGARVVPRGLLVAWLRKVGALQLDEAAEAEVGGDQCGEVAEPVVQRRGRPRGSNRSARGSVR